MKKFLYICIVNQAHRIYSSSIQVANGFRYAPQKTPFSIAERGFAILDITITLL